MVPVTKRQRREAILICACAASAETAPATAETAPATADRIVLELELDPRSGDLADDTWFDVHDAELNARERWAEAEARLRTLT